MALNMSKDLACCLNAPGPDKIAFITLVQTWIRTLGPADADRLLTHYISCCGGRNNVNR